MQPASAKQPEETMHLSQAPTRKAIAEGNLSLLQELLRRDPDSYRDEFDDHFQHFLQSMKLVQLEPLMHPMSVDPLMELTNFLASVVCCYPEEAKLFGATILQTLSSQAMALDRALRLSLCKALVTMNNRNAAEPLAVMQLFFELANCDDKSLRKFIVGSLICMIKNRRGRAVKLSKKRKRFSKRALSADAPKIQAYVFSRLSDSRAVSARVAQTVAMEAFRKGYWRDTKTANALAECVFHRVPKIQASTIRFFLGSPKDEEGVEDDSDSDAEGKSRQGDSSVLKEVMLGFRHAKKTRKRAKNVQRVKKEVGREKKSKRDGRAKLCNLEAIRSIYDPQQFADRLYACLESKRNEKFAVRLLQMALCARVIGVHRLQTLGFYSYLQRYFQPKQREVTRVLLYAAQACHELVPPDIVQGLVRAVAQGFVTDRNSPEAMTVGLNTIREIFANSHAAATEELLRDLTQYKSYRNKNVSMAARGLITLFRTVNPRLLHHKDRGRVGVANAQEQREQEAAPQFGALKALNFVPGADILSEAGPTAAAAAVTDKGRKRKRPTHSDSDDDWVDVASSAGSDGSSASADELSADCMDLDEGSDDDDDDDGWVTDDSAELDDDGWVTDDGAELDDEEEEAAGELERMDDESPKAVKKSVRFQLPSESAAKPQPPSESAAAPQLASESAAKPQQRLSKSQRKQLKAVEKLESKKDTLERAQLISESRILTDEDFRQIRAHQIRQSLKLEKKLDRGGKRTNDEVLLDEEVNERMSKRDVGDNLARLNDIEHFHKRRKQSKAERQAQVEVGREGREEFGKPKKRGPHVGRTNRELAKHKNFQMVKQKLRGKNRQRSFRDQQISLRNYLIRQSGRKAP